MKFFFITVLILALIGCAQIPSFRDSDDLESFESDIKYVLNDDVIYEERKGFVDWIYGIKKGVYSAKYQDNEAYYFVGDGFSSCIGTKGKTGNCSSFLKGGLWVSKKDSNDIRMFYIDGTPEGGSEVNMGWMYYFSIGSIIIETPNASFAKRVAKSKVVDASSQTMKSFLSEERSQIAYRKRYVTNRFSQDKIGNQSEPKIQDKLW